MTRAQAWEIFIEFNQDPFLMEHAVTVEETMKVFADKLGYSEERDFWGNVGLLHDIDFGMYPEAHCKKAREILEAKGVEERLIHAVVSHGYGIVVDVQPEHEMEKVLYAVDELTGLIGATVLMRPSKSIQDMELSSVKKKFKTKAFAAGCSREVIASGAEMLGWSLDELMLATLMAMKTFKE